MTWLDFEGQRSRSHLGSSMWWWSHPRRHWVVEDHLLMRSCLSVGTWSSWGREWHSGGRGRPCWTEGGVGWIWWEYSVGRTRGECQARTWRAVQSGDGALTARERGLLSTRPVQFWVDFNPHLSHCRLLLTCYRLQKTTLLIRLCWWSVIFL